MAMINGPKYPGPHVVDLTDVQDDLVDLPPGALKGARAEKDGFGQMMDGLGTAVAAHGEEVGITPGMYQSVVDDTERLEKLRAHEARLEKTLEVCKETRAKVENNREEGIGRMAAAVQRSTKSAKDAGVMAPFEKLIAYNSQVAEKAAHTRRKNAEEKAAEATPPAGDPTQPA